MDSRTSSSVGVSGKEETSIDGGSVEKPVPVWTPFDCCFILIQKEKERNKRRKKGTKPRKVPEEKPNRLIIRKTERKKDRERER